MESKKEFKTPSLGYSAFVLAALAISTFVQFKILGASLNVTMFLNWLLMTLLAIPLGFTYDDLEKKAAENLAGVLTTLFIMYAIGCLAGSWMASGTVPAIIYYGMDLMNAKFFLPTSLVLCSIVSVATGTSWGTLGTMGIALLGIGTGLQLQDILTFKNKDVRGKSEITVKIGAKNIENTFTVPEELQKIITDYTEGKDPDAYLILGHKTQNRPVCREQAYRVLRAAGHKIGLSSIGVQTMRKTFAWNYYKKTGDIYHLQHLFNHASPSITYRFIGEKPNMEVVLKKMTPQENARSRYMLYLNGSGKKRLTDIIDTLTSIKEDFDNPANNDAFYGTVECLLDELDALITNYKETRESENPF